MRSRLPVRLVATLASVVALAAFAGPAAANPSTAPRATKPSGSITVFAAASLTAAFTKLAAGFEKKYPGTSVTFNYAGSDTLATQIEQGAPADVFASAAPMNMADVVKAGDVSGKPVVFAHNLLEIAVQPGNPKKIRTLQATVQPNVQLVLCAPTVPCGKYALEAYAKAHVTVPQVPTGEDVKDVLNRVALGQADTAIVYRTDVLSAKGQVSGVLIPPSQNVLATYPVATLKGSHNPTTAKAFVQYVTSPVGKATLATFAFITP